MKLTILFLIIYTATLVYGLPTNFKFDEQEDETDSELKSMKIQFFSNNNSKLLIKINHFQSNLTAIEVEYEIEDDDNFDDTNENVEGRKTTKVKKKKIRKVVKLNRKLMLACLIPQESTSVYGLYCRYYMNFITFLDYLVVHKFFKSFKWRRIFDDHHLDVVKILCRSGIRHEVRNPNRKYYRTSLKCCFK